MSPHRWPLIETVFADAAELPPGERAVFLDAACAGDATLRAEVEAMLAVEVAAEAYFDALGQNLPTKRDVGVGPPHEATPPLRVGPYRLVGLLGRGGMGTVHLAERDDGAFEQRVAVKLIGAPTPQLVHRFDRERRILAALEHPHIARLLDGGVTDDGRPFFVMECVEGRRLDRYCDEERLSVEERLRLFAVAGRAVAYAHQNLVVHRDLKPSNVLVTDAGEVKLLDFGIAKLLGAEDAALVTQTGPHLMTPAYASPEQVRGAPVTTASDVYQLGVVLYELLAGHRPYRFGSPSPAEVERIVCETIPAKPSAAVTQTEEVAVGGHTETITPEGVGRVRRTTPERLRKALRGDLDHIVLKALRKEPGRRYATAGELVEDVERHLSGRTVSARPDTVGYRVRKFVGRHRWGVATAVALLVLLLGYASTVTVQQAQTARERDRAERYAAFLTGLFGSADPFASAGAFSERDVTVREVLDVGVRRVHAELRDDPEIQTDLLGTIAQVYEALGEREQAHALYGEVVQRHRDRYGEGSPETVKAMRMQAWTAADPATADSLYRHQIALAREMEGGTGPLAAHGLANYGHFLMNEARLEESERVIHEALPVLRAAGADHRENLVGALLFLGQTERALNKLDLAEAHITEMFALRSTLSGPDHPRTAVAMLEVAAIAEQRGDFVRAEQWKRRAVAIFEETLGEGHPFTVTALNNLAFLLIMDGRQEEGERERRLAEAEVLLRRVLALRRNRHGEVHRETAGTLQNLAALILRQGRPEEAEPLFLEVYEINQSVLPADHPQRVFPLLSLTELYLQRSHHERAEVAAREATLHLRRVLPDGHPYVSISESRWGEALTGLGRYAEAEPLLVRSHERLTGVEGMDDRRDKARHRLAALYRATGRITLARQLENP